MMSSPQSPVPGAGPVPGPPQAGGDVPGAGPVPGPPQPGGAEASVAEARARLEQLEATPDASPADVADALDEVRDALRRGLSDSGTG